MDVPNGDHEEHDQVTVGRPAGRPPLDVRDEPALGYSLPLRGQDAAALARDLLTEHPGARLYDPVGTVGPVDGRDMAVLRVGAFWSHGRPLLLVTVPPPGLPEKIDRVGVESLDWEDR